ncbi:hypothetical protein BH11MYX3_BH11MYX3_20810 [soil metagenome]
MRTIKTISPCILFAIAACGDDGNAINPPPVDAAPMADAPVTPPGTVYKQVEHLARPGINEALLISEGFLGGYNATAPSFAGVPAATLGQVVGEAKTVLKAVYLGSCLLNGALGLTAAQGVKPAGMICHAVGPALWTENTLAGVTLTAASTTAAQAYADKVFSQFEPDVMRIDTSAPSGYLTLCGDASSTPLLCGGRNLHDDVIDVTYNYLINGAATPKGAYNQVNALTSDGVNFSEDDANNAYNTVAPVPNAQQYHPNVIAAFPYSAPPL